MRRQAELIRLGMIVRLCRHVHDQRFLRRDALEAMVHERWYDDEERVEISDEEFVHDAVCRRVLTRIVQHDLHHAADTDEMIGLTAMVMPRLHDARVRTCQIYLAE